MRIAIPLTDTGTLAEEFSRATTFTLYDVHDQTRAVTHVGREPIPEPGCGRTPPVLRTHGVEVVLGHRVSQKAENHLLEVGIVAIKDAPLLTPDALIAHLVSGTLQATPPETAVDGAGCHPGGCGHCGSHAQEQTATPQTQTCANHAPEAQSACGSTATTPHACGSKSADQPTCGEKHCNH